MDKQALRPVEIKAGDKIEKGFFHGLGHISDGEGGCNTCAIVELEDGQMNEYACWAIRFLDRG